MSECPEEVLMLLDHAIEAGLPLVQYSRIVTSLDISRPYAQPLADDLRVCEGTDTAEKVTLCWTVGVRRGGDARDAVLEFREDERRWVGFEFIYGRWVRFYAGPVLR